jgi:hypothetical protein
LARRLLQYLHTFLHQLSRHEIGANVDKSTLEAELRASKREVQSALQGLRRCKEEQYVEGGMLGWLFACKH